jgi:hypothetical protein
METSRLYFEIKRLKRLGSGDAKADDVQDPTAAKEARDSGEAARISYVESRYEAAKSLPTSLFSVPRITASVVTSILAFVPLLALIINIAKGKSYRTARSLEST